MMDAASLVLTVDTTQVKKAGEDLKGLSESAKLSEQAASGQVAAWERQAATLGKSRTEIIAYDAAQLGLSKAQMASVQASISSIAAYDRQQVTQREVIVATAEQAAAQKALAAAQAQASAQVAAQVAAWTEQAAALGKSRIELIEMEAATLNLSAAQKESVAASIASIAAYDRQALAQREAAAAAAEQAAAQRALVASQAQALAATQAQVAAWSNQAASLGKSRTQLMEMQASQLDLTAAQKASVAQSIAAIEAHEKEAAAISHTKEKTSELIGELARFAGILGVAELAKQFIELSDSEATLTARMKSATDSTEEAHAAMHMLRDLASETQGKFEPLAHGFIEVGEAVKNLGGKAETTAQIMKALTFAARSQGQSSEDAATMAGTFARALNLGVQGGREFVGLLKQNDDVARALATGLGVTTQELKRLAQEGLVDPQRLVRALISQMQELEEQAKKMPKTVGGSLNEIWNEVQRAASNGNANALADFLHSVAVGIKLVQDNGKEFASNLVEVVLRAVTFGLSDNAGAWEQWSKRVGNAIKTTREASGKIRGNANFADPPELFQGDKAFAAAKGEFDTAIKGSNTAGGINARADQQIKVIDNIWNNMLKADKDKAAEFKGQYKTLIDGINRDRNLQLQALAKSGTAGLAAIYGQWDKQAALETAAFANLARVEQAGLAQQQSIIDHSHNLGILSEENYVKKRGDILIQGAKSDISRLSGTYATALSELEKVQASVPRTAEEAVQKQSKIAELTKTLTDLAVQWGLAEQKVGDITVQTSDLVLEARNKERQSIQQILDQTEDYIQGLKDANDDLQVQTQALGLTDAEAKKLMATHAADLDLRRQLLPIERELRELEITGQGDSARAQQLRASAVEITQQNRDQLGIQKERIDQYDVESRRIDGLKSAWAGVSDFVTGFVNSLQGGWKSAMKYMADQFKALLLKLLSELALQKFVLPLFLQVMGGGTGAGAVAGVAQQGGSLLNGLGSLFGGQGTSGAGMLGGLGSSVGLAGGVTSGLMGLFGSGAGGVAAGAGLEAGAGAAAGFGSAAAGAGGIAGMAGTVAAAIPVIGWAIAAAAAIYAIVQANKKPTPVNAQFEIGDPNKPASDFEDSISVANKKFGQIGFGDKGTQQFSGEVGKAFDTMVSTALDEFAKRMSGEQTDKLASILQNTTFKAFSGTFTTQDFLGKYGGDILGQVVTAAFKVLDPALGDVVEKFHGTAEEVGKFADTLLAIHDASDKFSDAFKANIVGALGDATQESADKVAVFVSIYQALGNTIAALGPKLEALDPANILAFVDALGGTQKALASQAFIAANFTTQQDRLSLATIQLGKDFADLNLAVPANHQAFLDLLGSFDLTTDKGREAYASVSALAGAFVAVNGTADAAASATKQLTAAQQAYESLFSVEQQDAHKLTADWAKVHDAWTDLGKQLLALGVDHIPTTRAGFVSLVESIDTTTTAGQALHDSLVNLAPAIVDINDVVDGLLTTFHQNFDSPQQAIQADWDKVHDVWTRFGTQLLAVGDHIPTTTAAFHDFVEAIIAMYGPTSAVAIALLHLGNETIVDLNHQVDGLSNTMDNLGRHITELQDAASKAGTEFQSIMSAIDEISGADSVGNFGAKESLKLKLLAEQKKKYEDLLNKEKSGSDPYGALAGKYEEILLALGLASQTAAKDLAQFVVLSAQYGDAIAEQLVGLEDWYAQQQLLLAGNVDALAALKLLFDAKWKDILNGVTKGVDDTADQLIKLKLAIQDYLKSLKLSDLSPSSPVQKFLEAKRNYDDLLVKAQGGDQDALSKITGASDVYLQLARQLFASSPQYNAIFDAIFKQLTELSKIADTTHGGGTGPDTHLDPIETEQNKRELLPGHPAGPPSSVDLKNGITAIVDALSEVKVAIHDIGAKTDKVGNAIGRVRSVAIPDRKS